jgi:opacity protein-like surface antigen
MKNRLTVFLLFLLASASQAQDSLQSKRFALEGEMSFGYSYNSFSSVNSFLAKNGFNTISRSRFTAGVGSVSMINRFVFGAGIEALIPMAESQPGNLKTSLQGFTFAPMFGYCIVQTKHSTIYPYVRLADNILSLKITDGQTAVDASSLINATNRNSSLDYQFFVLDVGMIINRNIPAKNRDWDCPQNNRYWTIGLKAGYSFMPGGGEVKYNSQVLRGAPTLDYQGPYVRLSIGFGTRHRKLNWQ